MSQSTKPGRRTPLTLGPNKNQRKSTESSDKSDSSRSGTPVVNIEKLNADVIIAELTKKGKTVAAVNTITENNTTKPTAQQQKLVAPSSSENIKKENGSSAKKENGAAAKEDKSKAVPVLKTDSKDDKNVAQKQNGNTSAAKGKDAVTNDSNGDKQTARESPRQREIRETKEKEDVKDKIQLQAPAVTITPATPEVIKQSPRKQDTAASPKKPTEIQKQTLTEEVKAKEKEKEIELPFDHEMESLIMEDDTPITPRSTGKILKLNDDLLPSRSSLQNASTIVNLSTVSVKSTESPLRHISGRRSARPLPEIVMQHRLDTYRKLPSDFNDSISSMNATVGSEIPNDSFRTPVVAIKGRKRNVNDEPETEESPKRARLDLSGLLGLVASPVTMLRNKFSRAKLQCSTPNKNELQLDTEDVTGTNSNNPINVSGIEVADAAMEEPLESLTTDGENATTNVDQVDFVPDVETPNAEDVSVEIREAKKSRCSIM